MNIENIQNKTAQIPITTGERLRIAREQIGLSQQAVAKRLCLKVSTIQDIEDNKVNPNLASTFLRGYIRSYAKLVHISEEELIPMTMMVKQESKLIPIKNFSKGNKISWLIGFTWLVMFVMLGLTGLWWWQNDNYQQQEIKDLTDKYSDNISHYSESK